MSERPDEGNKRTKSSSTSAHTLASRTIRGQGRRIFFSHINTRFVELSAVDIVFEFALTAARGSPRYRLRLRRNFRFSMGDGRVSILPLHWFAFDTPFVFSPRRFAALFNDA